MIIKNVFEPVTGYDFYANPSTGVNRLVTQFTVVYLDGVAYQDSFVAGGFGVIQDAFTES